MSKEFFDAVKAIEAEKGIPAEYLYEKISAAIICLLYTSPSPRDS